MKNQVTFEIGKKYNVAEILHPSALSNNYQPAYYNGAECCGFDSEHDGEVTLLVFRTREGEEIMFDQDFVNPQNPVGNYTLIVPQQHSIEEQIKLNSGDIKGTYAEFYNKHARINQFAFEVAMHANSGTLSRKGIENAVGKEIVRLSLLLYPNVRLGDVYAEPNN